MSSNGTDPHYATAARLASSLGKPGPLSASEREQQRIAYIAAVDGMATVLSSLEIEFDPAHGYSVSKADRVLFNLTYGHSKELQSHAKEIGSLKMQQGVTFNSLAEFCGRPFLARLLWLVTGR